MHLAIKTASTTNFPLLEEHSNHLNKFLHTTQPQQLQAMKNRRGLTRVGVRVAICFSPLVRRGLVIEFVLWLNQRKRVWDQGSTTHRLVVSQTTVTAAFLGAVREVKGNTALRLQRRSQDMQLTLASPWQNVHAL